MKHNTCELCGGWFRHAGPCPFCEDKTATTYHPKIRAEALANAVKNGAEKLSQEDWDLLKKYGYQ